MRKQVIKQVHLKIGEDGKSVIAEIIGEDSKFSLLITGDGDGFGIASETPFQFSECVELKAGYISSGHLLHHEAAMAFFITVDQALRVKVEPESSELADALIASLGWEVGEE